jgi:signal transduction histidine kinase
MIFENKFNISVFVGTCLWIVFFAIFHGYQNIEPFTVSVELICDVLILIMSWRLFKASVFYKQYFLLFFISFIGILISNFSYAFVYLFLEETQLTSWQSMLFMGPYFIFLLFQIIFWLMIDINFIVKKKLNLIALIPFFIASSVIFAIYLVTSIPFIKYHPNSNHVETILGAMDLILSSLVILALICCRNKGVYLVALSLSIIVATNFWWMYLYHNRALGVADYSASFWFFGLILMVYGLAYISKTKQLECSSWFGTLRGIKSQVILWTFSLAILSVLALCFLGYGFKLINSHIIGSLPFLIMIYSVIVILISNYVGNTFERPFKRIEKNIIDLMGIQQNESPIRSLFYTEEFSFLQKFIIDTFYLYEERNKEKRAIADLALQVAHDIRSPVAAISMLSKECIEIPERQRASMRDAAERIQDIANNLLSQYSTKKIVCEKLKSILASTSILSVLSEKRLQFHNENINFIYEASDVASFSCIHTNEMEFERMLSNLLNNAVEAIPGIGSISVTLETSNENLIVKIKDTGKGMHVDRIDKLLHGEEINSDKFLGHGLGLAHAKSFLNKHNALIQINSEAGNGTEIVLTFKTTALPIWITDEIIVNNDDHVMILDDDISIHGAWDKVFSPILKENKKLEVSHFTKAMDFLNSIKNVQYKNRIVLLVDYELIKQNISGLDVILASGIERSILVTSHYEDMNIVKKSILLNTKILPKILASRVKLKLSQDLEKDLHEEDNNQNIDLVVLENNKELADILSYLYKIRGKFLKIYNTPYQLIEALSYLNKETKICLDYDLSCPVTGIDLAKFLKEKGFQNLYLATGFKIQQSDAPEYLQVLKGKMDLLNL